MGAALVGYLAAVTGFFATVAGDQATERRQNIISSLETHWFAPIISAAWSEFPHPGLVGVSRLFAAGWPDFSNPRQTRAHAQGKTNNGWR